MLPYASGLKPYKCIHSLKCTKINIPPTHTHTLNARFRYILGEVAVSLCDTATSSETWLTKDIVATICVSSKSEDVRVVCSHDCQRVGV